MASPLDQMYEAPKPAPVVAKTPPAAQQWHDPSAGSSVDFASLSGDEQMAAIQRETALANSVNEYEREQDEKARANLGVTPSQFDIAGGAGMLSGQQDARGDVWLEQLFGTVNSPSSPNPLKPIREEYAGQMGGLLAEQDTNYQGLHAAQQGEMQAHAQAYQQEAARQQAAIDVQEQKAVRDMERRNDALQKSQMVMSKVSAAADRLNESPDIDPNRYWASQSAGRKFGWGISAALLGFAGLNPTGALTEAINRDIDAQKATFAQKQAGFGARMEEMGAQRSVYQDLREAIGDEQATDMAMEHARLGQAESAFKAMAVKEGIPVQVAEQNVFLNEWRQRRVEIERGLSELVAKTPSRIGGGSRPALTPLQQKVALAELKDARGEGNELRKLAITQGGQAAGDKLKHEADMAKIDAEGGKKDRVNYENRRMIAKETAVPNRIRELAADILADVAANNGDVPGVGSVYIPGLGAPKHQLTRAARDMRRKLDMLGEYDITNLTGAVSSPEQQKVIKAFLDGDESAITSGLTEIQRAMDALVNTIEGADPEAAADIRAHTKKGSVGWRGARVDAPVGSSTSVEED